MFSLSVLRLFLLQRQKTPEELVFLSCPSLGGGSRLSPTPVLLLTLRLPMDPLRLVGLFRAPSPSQALVLGMGGVVLLPTPERERGMIQLSWTTPLCLRISVALSTPQLLWKYGESVWNPQETLPLGVSTTSPKVDGAKPPSHPSSLQKR